MPGWSEARRAGQTARFGQLKQRSDPRHSGRIPHYKFNPKQPECIFCHRKKPKRMLTTGYLPITGAIWKCSECETQYNEEKQWEEQYR